MIIINLDSLNLATDLLRNIDLSSENVYFNDGVTASKIVGFTIHYEDFEANGMLQTIERKYTLELSNSDNLTYWFHGGQIKTMPRMVKNPSDYPLSIPVEISKYMF